MSAAEGLPLAKRLADLLNEIEENTPYRVYTRDGNVVVIEIATTADLVDGDAYEYVLTDHSTGTWRVNGLG